MDPSRWPSLATTIQKELFQTWKNNLADLLLIQKEGTDLQKAAKFFRKELDADIPFTKMGFFNLFEFFFHCNDVLQLRVMNNKYFLFYREEACPADQKHLRQLARGQASSKTKIGVGFGIKILPTVFNTHPVPIHNLLQMNSAQIFLNQASNAALMFQNQQGNFQQQNQQGYFQPMFQNQQQNQQEYFQPMFQNQQGNFQPRFQNQQGNLQQQNQQGYFQPMFQNQQGNFQPRFQNQQGNLQQQNQQGYLDPQRRTQPSSKSGIFDHRSNHSFVPGPPTPVRSSLHFNHWMSNLNIDDEFESPSNSSDEFDMDFDSPSNKRPNNGQNVCSMPRPSYNNGNSNAKPVPPPPMPKLKSVMSIDTFDNTNFQKSLSVIDTTNFQKSLAAMVNDVKVNNKNKAVNSVIKEERTSNRHVSSSINSPCITQTQEPKEVSNLKNLNENEAILVEESKNISTSCQNLTVSNEPFYACFVKQEAENLKRIKEKQLANMERLQLKDGRTFELKMQYGSSIHRVNCHPLPDFINHELAFVYIPLKNVLECVYADDIIVCD